ncbi:MAG: hypothetical protein ABI041_03810 [Bdellovibrionia bacterium]
MACIRAVAAHPLKVEGMKMRPVNVVRSGMRQVNSLSHAAIELFDRNARDSRGERKVHSGKAKRKIISQAELQDIVQRFSMQRIERLSQTFEDVERAGDAATVQSAIRHLLRIASSLVDIATGPYPEVNLLDMTALVRLCRKVLEDY